MCVGEAGGGGGSSLERYSTLWEGVHDSIHYQD